MTASKVRMDLSGWVVAWGSAYSSRGFSRHHLCGVRGNFLIGRLDAGGDFRLVVTNVQNTYHVAI